MSGFIGKFPVVSLSGKPYEVIIEDFCGDSGIKNISLYKYEDVKNIFGKIKEKRIFLNSKLVCVNIQRIIYNVEKLITDYEEEQNGTTFDQQNIKEFEDWDGVIKKK
jgi:hypothetical protein